VRGDSRSQPGSVRRQAKPTPKISLSPSLLERARRAAYAEGYGGERQFSDFVSMVLKDWIDSRENLRGDKAYPEIPDE
jgi:hypothetical protein